MFQKIKYLILLFLFLALPLQIKAISYVDSLNTALIQHTGKEKIPVLHNLFIYWIRQDIDSARYYVEEQLAIAQSINDQHEIANAFYNLSSYYFYNSEYGKSNQFFLPALEIYKSINDSLKTASITNNMALNYRRLGDYSTALEYLFNALSMREAINDMKGQSSSLSNIGGIYRLLNQPKKALEYYQLALDINRKQGYTNKVASSLNNIGVVHKSLGNITLAKEYYENGLNIALKKNYRELTLNILRNLGIYHLEQDSLTKALQYFNDAADLSIKIKNRLNICQTHLDLGNVYTKLKAYKKAEQHLKKGLKIASNISSDFWRADAYNLFSAFYQQQDNYLQAYTYQTKYIQLKDSIKNDDDIQKMLKMQSNYELNKKRQELEKTKNKVIIERMLHRRSRNVSWVLASSLLVSVFLGLLWFRQSRLIHQHKTLTLEQKLFRLQMNPHFIFNSLTAIQSFMIKNHPKEAARYLSSFAKLIRLVLVNSREEFIALDKEIQGLEYYLDLQQLRFSGKFTYNIHIDPEIETELINIPPMLAQPFIENALEHGLKDLNKKGEIDISFQLEDNLILFNVEDNGVGLQKSLNNKTNNEPQHQSLATTITKERLEIYKKTSRRDINFAISEKIDVSGEVDGTRVSFHIPFN